jgi:hypothetical protein
MLIVKYCNLASREMSPFLCIVWLGFFLLLIQGDVYVERAALVVPIVRGIGNVLFL